MFIRFLWLAALAALLVTGCSSTIVTGSWKNPQFIGKVNKVYIIGVAQHDRSRYLFEDEFSKQLAEAGLVGIASYNDFPGKSQINQVEVKNSAKSQQADAVLVARAIGKRVERIVTPGSTIYSPAPYYHSYGSYYSRSYEVIHTPATVSDYEVITIEANLYDTESEKLIWSAQMETFVDQNINDLIVDFVKQVVKDMDDKGLI